MIKKMKTTKILYWTSTGLVSAFFLMSSSMYLTKDPGLMKSFESLGFPVFFVTLLGIAKLSGALALLNPWSQTLKEWAYAGFTFTLIGAVWVHVVTSTSFLMPLVAMALLGVSYYFRMRLRKGAALKMTMAAA